MSNPIQYLHLHGPGRAATSLARMARRASISTIGLSGGTSEGGAAASAVLGEVPWHGPLPDPEGLKPGTLLVVGVPDDAIEAAAGQLAEVLAGIAVARAEDLTVVHLAGMKDLSVLAALAEAGLGTAGFHPLRSFASRDPGEGGLGGALVAVESESDRVSESLHSLARSLGGCPFALAKGMRPLYHLGASMAGNAVLGLLETARAALRAAGVPESLAIAGLATLMGGAIENAEREGLSAALTGPVVRGDVATVRAHLRAIDETMPDVRPLYLDLVKRQLALCAHRPDAERVAPVRDWFDQESSS